MDDVEMTLSGSAFQILVSAAGGSRLPIADGDNDVYILSGIVTFVVFVWKVMLISTNSSVTKT